MHKVVLITGCSSGFGFLTALRLAVHSKVYASVRDYKKGEKLLAAAKNRGLNINLVEIDVTKQETINEAIKNIVETEKRLDILINNAGYGLGGFFEDLTDEEFQAQMDTNFFGVLRVTRAVLPMMRKQGNGKIINLSSIAGMTGFPGLGAYNASKWSIEGFSESLRYELKPFGIQVILVEPGLYKTKIFKENARLAKNAFDKNSAYFRFSEAMKKRLDSMVDKTKRDPDEVARLMEKICLKKKPAFRNVIGRDAQVRLWLRYFLPYRWQEWLVAKSLGL
jgi:NAD(P)-dependent dehydrogenase (short-subunit alcohol dehydrogenase family)